MVGWREGNQSMDGSQEGREVRGPCPSKEDDGSNSGNKEMQIEAGKCTLQKGPQGKRTGQPCLAA